MGATDFYLSAHGKDAGDAFSEAVQNARHESGHGGYTGTIAEKDDFVTIRIPGMGELPTREQALDHAGKLLDDEDPRITDKRGPAGCIECRPKGPGKRSFLFFGWAAS